MSLTIKKILTSYNFSDRNDTRRIKYIVIHYFGSLGSALSVANYFAGAYRGASAHYSLDDGETVYQCVEDEDVAWHCGTSGKYYHPYCRNSNSIGIEVRPYKIDTSRSSISSDTDWYFHDKTIDNLVELTKVLMKKYGVDADHVIRHYDVTHKLCPRPYVGDDVNDYYLVSGNKMWAKFKTRLTAEESEDDDMDGKDISEKLNAYLAQQPTSDYARESSKKAIKSGLFSDGDKDGLIDDPRGILTREQLAVVLNRAGLLDK